MPYKNIEERNKYQRAYFKEYRKRNSEKLNKWNRDWRKNNPEFKKKQAEYVRKYRKLYPERFRAYDRKNGLKQREKFRIGLKELRIEKGGKCSQCGYDEVIDILQFHHSGEDKEIEVTRCHTIENAREEAKKCILLCPNCHAIETLKNL